MKAKPDWWNAGFDDYFSGIPYEQAEASLKDSAAYARGWMAAATYSRTINNRKASPRDTEIADLKEIMGDG